MQTKKTRKTAKTRRQIGAAEKFIDKRRALGRVTFSIDEITKESGLSAIAGFLNNSSEYMREQAILTLIEMKQCQYMPEFRRRLSDDSEMVRRASAEAANQCKDRESVDLLIRMLPFDYRAAAAALGSIGDPKAVVPLIALLQKNEIGDDVEVIKALGQLRDARAFDSLLSVLPKSSGFRRIAIVTALGRLRDPRAVEPIMSVLNSEEGAYTSDLHKAVMDALREIPGPATVKALQKIVKDASLHRSNSSWTSLADQAAGILKRLGVSVSPSAH
jgi:HEAT repeat protein